MKVLILVVMDDALAQPVRGANGELERVLILVVMDDALAPLDVSRQSQRKKSLNPCCNG